jgi:hypothetical protein
MKLIRICSTECAGRAIALAVCALAGGAPISATELVGTTRATFVWTPASGPVEGYLVYVSRDGQDPLGVVVVAEPRVTLPGYDPGDTIEVSVRAVGHDALGNWILGPSSEPSEAVSFAAPPPLLPAQGALLLHCAGCQSLRYVALNDLAGEPLAELFAPGGSWGVANVGDFDGNGARDILWRDADGRLLAYLMRDRAVERAAVLATSGLANHRVLGSADFDADGDAEIVLRDPAGRIFFLEARDTNLAPIAALTEAKDGLQVLAETIGVGDFDGDGTPELLRRRADRELEVWAVENFASGPRTPVGIAIPDGWLVEKLADLDGDATTDLVWRLPNHSRLILKLEDRRVADAWLLPADPGDEERQVRASASLFPGRGEMLVLQHGATGRIVLLDPARGSSIGRVVLLDPGSSWTVVGVAE